jgi:two-component system, OmpR family, sensor histidine kinase VicK
LLAVADTGYGIPAEAHPHLFNEFYRVRTPDLNGIKGHGLGLSLVKAVVDIHKGKVWFESEEGVGSTFFVQLPQT